VRDPVGGGGVVEVLGAELDAPVITGKTPVRDREQLFAAFRTGELSRLVVSKVANFSIDLPEANVAIQVSGTFGSRQEEAQRLGRILRPKADGGRARFYTVVSRDTNDTDFAQRRQRFLAEQGYAYRLVDAAYERRSVAVSSNLHPAGFDELMPKTLATATVDRLLHHAHLCVTQGDSVRLSQATTGKGVVPLT
jgi:superfamily II DNA or RNA helicase